MKIIKSLLVVFLLQAGQTSSCSCSKIFCERKNSCHLKWTHDEDELLKSIVEACGIKFRWRNVADEFNYRNNNKLIYRSAKACRERYAEYISLPVDRHFSEEEDANLIKYVNKFGKRWTFISRFFTNKSPSMLRHRNTVLCCRCINNVALVHFNESKAGRDVSSSACDNSKGNFFDLNFKDFAMDQQTKDVLEKSDEIFEEFDIFDLYFDDPFLG